MSVLEFKYQVEGYLVVVLTREAFESFDSKADICLYYQAGSIGYESFNVELKPFISQTFADLEGNNLLEILLSLRDSGELHPEEEHALARVVSLQIEAGSSEDLALGSAFVEAVCYCVYLAYLVRGQ